MLLFRLLILFGIYYYFYHYLGIQTLDQLQTFTFTKLDELKVFLFDLNNSFREIHLVFSRWDESNN